jgi:pimeloyl-ACP methyl ester carboxylesterase
VAELLCGSDRLFWILKNYAPSLFMRVMGMPKDLRPTAEERARIVQTIDSFFPINPRKRGVFYDLYVSNPDVQNYPLEAISVPTLIINSRDDGLSAFENADRASGRVPSSKLVTADRGGHLLLGSENRIQEEIAAVLRQNGPTEPTGGNS